MPRSTILLLLGSCLVVAPGCSNDSSSDEFVPVTIRVSVASDGTEADGASQGPVSVDSEGRYVAFTSTATNLVLGDTNGFRDVFVRDTQSGVTIRPSVSLAGDEGDADADQPHISPDGTWLVFRSASTTLLGAVTNGVQDVFLKDLLNGSIQRVSVDTDEMESNGASHWGSVSQDGRFVAFSSDATNLVMGDTNGVRDVFLRDIVAGTTIRISVDSMGTEANGASDRPAISPDGMTIAFQSAATNLVTGDTNGFLDIFMYDVASGIVERVSVATDGTQGDADVMAPALAENGRFVAYATTATMLVETDTNGTSDIFLHDAVPETTVRVSETEMQEQLTGTSESPSLGFSGQFVAYRSTATNLDPLDTNGVPDIFLLDRNIDDIILVSYNSAGVVANGASSSPAVSAQGQRVAFLSDATNLDEFDTNGVTDVFIHIRSE